MTKNPSHLFSELISALENLYKPAGITVTAQPLRETESVEYEACRLSFDGKIVLFRKAKITPKKIGQFVTLWKRTTKKSEIAPFDETDEIEWVIIRVSEKTHNGHFLFNQKILLEKDIFSANGTGGKRALRVYPPWNPPTSAQALKTQKWQLQYFFSLNDNPLSIIKQIKKLLKTE